MIECWIKRIMGSTKMAETMLAGVRGSGSAWTRAFLLPGGSVGYATGDRQH
jgi:hypothetical protein